MPPPIKKAVTTVYILSMQNKFVSLFASDNSGGLGWANGVTMFNIASPLNDLLERGDFTLEDLLEEDELIQEMKARNDTLLHVYVGPRVWTEDACCAWRSVFH